jgi:Holliday junction resolvase
MTATRPQPESLILRAVRNFLVTGGWYVVRIQQGMGCHKGIADLVAMKDGRTVWCEIKTATGTQSEHQVEFETRVLAAGGEYIVARSVDDVTDLVDCLRLP